MGEVKNVYCLGFVKTGSTTKSLYPGCLVSDNIDGKSYNLSLSSLSFTKKVYEPCHVKADVKIALGTNTNTLPSFSKVVAYFKNFSSITLKIGSVETSGPGGQSYKGDKGTLGENYIIFDMQPVYRTGGGQTAMSVNLEIYSPDFFFTLRKYSKTYTAKKLGALIDQGLTDFNISSLLKVVHDNQTYLTYTDQKTKASAELIQPYLVQYNESFYELIARTANRCGEWLYFENGKLYLGWKDSCKKLGTTDLSASDFQSVVFRSRIGEKIASGNEVASYSRDSVSGDSVTPGAWNYNMEVSADEYLAPLTYDKFDTFNDGIYGWFPMQTHLFAQFVAKMMNAESFFKGFVDWSIDTIKTEVSTAQRYKQGIDKGNETYFKKDIKDIKDQYNDLSPLSTDGGDSSNKAADNVTDFTYTPFSTNPSYKNLESNFTTKVGLDLYKKIRDTQIKLDEKSLDMDMGGKIREISVGEIISVKDFDDSGLYMVTEVIGCDEVVGETRAETMKIRAIPIDSNKEAIIPPARKEDYVPRGGQQTAVITDNSDPLRQGRVRVRFSWEKSDSAGSPWIRMASPFASKDNAGLYITPQKGDEVLVDFAGGNMERPVIVGSLFDKVHQPPYGQRVFQSIFRSPGGHAIKTSDGSDIMAFVGSIIPAIGFLRSFCPYIKAKVDSDGDAAKLLGGMDFSDEFGIYSLSLNSAKRQISIESPFGDVKINAFTGITINAPNGDVKIVGKNVDIVANNKLTLTSGQNIKNKFVQAVRNKNTNGLKDEAIKNVVVDALLKKALDLSLIRTVFETFVKPIDGTLSIKSNRFMKLEAGKGEAHIPSTEYAVLASDLHGDRDKTLRKLGRTISYVCTYSQRQIAQYKTDYKAIADLKAPLDTLLTQLDANIADNVKAAAVIQRGLGNNAQDFTADDIRNAVPAQNRAGLAQAAVDQAVGKVNELLAAVKEFRPRAKYKPSTLCPPGTADIYISKVDEFYDTLVDPAKFKSINDDATETFGTAIQNTLSDPEKKQKRHIKWALITKLIDEFSAGAQLTYVVAPSDQASHTAIKNKLLQGDDATYQEWQTFIRRLSADANITDPGKQTKDDKLMKWLGFVPFVKAEERSFFSTDNSRGRILISDNDEGRTLQFEKGSLVQYDNKGYIQVIKQIKMACGVPEVAPVIPPPGEDEDEERAI